jgi:hypothetical protein
VIAERISTTSGIALLIHKAWEERFHVPVFETCGFTETAIDMESLFTHEEIGKFFQEE